MSNIIIAENNLPVNIDDLRKFVLIGTEKLTAIRAEIRAIKKLDLAMGVYEQKLKEGQMIAETVVDAETRIGILTTAIPTAPGGKPYHTSDNVVASMKPKTKKDVITDLGFTKKQVERFESLAKHPEAVEQAKAEARENNTLVTKERIQEIIKKPHISRATGNSEWYTPPEYIEAARKVLGTIDLDPASTAEANKIVKAEKFFTAEDNGLNKAWKGKVWLNPPYASNLIAFFVQKLRVHYAKNEVSEAIVLVNNATETAWFNILIDIASAIVFPKSRVKFHTSSGEAGAPLQGQAFIYIGKNSETFLKVFKPFGWGALPCEE